MPPRWTQDESPMTAEDELAAAQAALAGEHACIYGYGVVGAHLPDDAGSAARALQAHRNRRDDLAALIRAAGGEPEPSAPTYELPQPVTDAATAGELAVLMETRLAALHADLVAAARSADLREFAAQALVSAALARTRWGGEQLAFPGLGGRPGTPGSTVAPEPETPGDTPTSEPR